MEKSKILLLPIFPRYREIVVDNVVHYSSAVYVHYGTEECVEILLQPVVNTGILQGRFDKQLLLENHLRECLRISKYIDVSIDYREELPCIDKVFKTDKEFTNLLITKYP